MAATLEPDTAITTAIRTAGLRAHVNAEERWIHMFRNRKWAIALAVAVVGVIGATALPSVAQTAPIVVEQLGDRSVFTDRVELKFKVKDHDGEMTVVSTQDASRTALA